MDVELVDLAGPEPEGWAEFTRKRRLHQVWEHGLLRLESLLSRNPLVLAVIRESGDVLGIAAALVCAVPQRPRFASPAVRPSWTPRWVDFYLPTLSGFPAIEFADGVDPDTRRAARQALEGALTQRIGPGLLGAVYRAVTPDLLPALTGRGRVVRDWPATTVLENHWDDTEGWMSALSRSRRKSLRRQLRHLAESDVVVRGGAGRTDIAPGEAAALINEHRARLGQRSLGARSPVPAAYLADLLGRPDVHLLTYHGESGLLAHNIMLDHPDRVVKQHWAAVPNGPKDLYFDAYIRAMRYLTETGRPSITAGAGKLDVKASLGFTAHKRHLVVVPRPLLKDIS